MLCSVREVALFFPVELEFYRLEFHWKFCFCFFFFFFLLWFALLCSAQSSNHSLGIFFFFIFFLDMQGAQKLKCVHAQNVIHKHSLTGKEADVNALKLRQHAFSIGTKLQKLLHSLHKHGFTMQMHLHCSKMRS